MRRTSDSGADELWAFASAHGRRRATAGVVALLLLGSPGVAFAAPPAPPAAPPAPSSDGDATEPETSASTSTASGDVQTQPASDSSDSSDSTDSPEPAVVREIAGPSDELSARDRRRLEGDRRRQRRSAWLSNRRALPSLRMAIGPTAPLAPARPAAAAFDLDAGLWIVPKPRARASFTLRPAVGYALVAERRDPRHAASLGVGLGVGSPMVTVSWVPALLVGAVDRAPMVAVRHGLEVALGYGIVSVQARHEIVPRSSGVEQALTVSVGFDFVAIAWLASASSQ